MLERAGDGVAGVALCVASSTRCGTHEQALETAAGDRPASSAPQTQPHSRAEAEASTPEVRDGLVVVTPAGLRPRRCLPG